MKKRPDIIPVQEAVSIIQNTLYQPVSERIPLLMASGRVLAEGLHADSDLPPFNRVTMDGIAIQYMAWEKGIRDFRPTGVQRAGIPALSVKEEDECLEVMTGATLPHNTDTIVPYEEVKESRFHFTVQSETVHKGQHVHLQGTDAPKGTCVVHAGKRITAAEIGAAASLGCQKVYVHSLPAIAIVSTGDELVEIDQIPLPHQIRRSNVYALEAAVARYGVRPTRAHLPDDPLIIEKHLEELIRENDALVLSGGISKGKYDLLPEILHSIGAEVLFHRIAQKPGKPMWFGKKGSCVIFALPGNPVSTFMCAYRYLIPWIQRSIGIDYQTQHAQLTQQVLYKRGMEYFQTVTIAAQESGLRLAIPVIGNGSGDFTVLAQSDGFLQLPADGSASPGQAFPVYLFR